MYELSSNPKGIGRPAPVEKMDQREILEQRLSIWTEEREAALRKIETANKTIAQTRAELSVIDGAVSPFLADVEVIPVDPANI